MNIEEAIKYMVSESKDVHFNRDYRADEALEEAYQLAIQALKEKQEREKEPVDIMQNAITGDWVQTCPDCGFTMQGSRRPASYCCNCGRKVR